MNPLLSRLAALRRRVLLLEGWRGVCALLTLLAGAVVVVGLLDWYVQLPSLVRGVLLAGILTGAGVVVYRLLFVPFRRPTDHLTLALRIEEEFPELNDALASTVQFLTEPADTPGAASGSPALRKKAVQLTMARTEQYDFGRIISYRGAAILGVSLLVVAAVAAHFAYRHPHFAGIALRRLADPFGGHTWTTVEVPDAPTRVAAGQPLAIKATLSGIIPRQARVEIVGEGQDAQRPDEKSYNLSPGSASIRHNLDMTRYTRNFKFRVVANDGSYPPRPGSWHTVEVVPPPRLVDLNGQPSPQVEVFPPAYTEEPSPQKLTPGSKMIKAWAGSAVVFRAATNRPVSSVWMEYRPRDVFAVPPVPAFRAAALMGLAGAGVPLPAVGELFVGRGVWDRVPAEINPEGTQFAVRFTPWMPGTCLLHLEDIDKLANTYAYELDVDIDPLPQVRLLQPATDLTLLPDADFALRFRAEDEIFALRSVYVEFQVKGADEAAAPARGRAVLRLPAGYEQGLPQLAAPLSVSETGAVEALKGKPKRVDATSSWALKNRFKVGDVIYLEVCADDYCDVYGSRPAGRSHQVKIQIVGKGELAKAVDEKLKQVRDELKQIQGSQKEALDIVKDVQNKDKVSDKDVERLVEAEAKQKQIEERVGTPDDGLRKELDKLQQLLKDNKMKESEAQLQAGMIKGALDRLAQQELPQIEQALADARKKLAAEANKEAKTDKDEKGPKTPPSSKKEDPLGKTAKLQDSALKNLDELAKALNPWADMQQVKAEVRGLLDQQQQIKRDLDKVKADKAKIDKEDLPKASKQELEKGLRDQLGKDAASLEDLAKRAEDLKKLLDDVQKKRQAEGDKENADRLKEAGKIADKAGLPGKMRDTAKELKEKAESTRKDPTPSTKAQQQQQKNADQLEKMLAALEGKEPDALEKLQKAHKKAKEEVEKLAQKMKELEQKLKDADQLKDNEERLQKKKELAQEFQDLKEQVEKEARELARLQDQRAAKELDKAAEQLDKAAGKLKQGDDPGEAQKDAQKDLKQAKKALEESEEELAREQLAKIADRLKGLKEREDAAVDRSKEFHKKLLAKKTWTDALGKTLDGDANAQEGIAREVRSLKEKLKEAKVFEHILDRAAKSMDEATQVMRDRKEEGVKTRQYDVRAGQAMEKEEIEDENEKNTETVRHQSQASVKLQRLLDAIKEELAKKPPEKKDDQAADNKPPEEQGPKLRSGDGIPPVAQLKALRAEQLDLNDRTAEFAKRNPNANQLTPEQRRELEQMEQDQRQLQELFRQMTASAEKKGDAP